MPVGETVSRNACSAANFSVGKSGEKRGRTRESVFHLAVSQRIVVTGADSGIALQVSRQGALQAARAVCTAPT